MSIKVVNAVIYTVCFPLFVALIALMLWWVVDNAKAFQSDTVANKVTNKVTNTVTNEAVNNTTIATETEVYKIVCVESADGYCKEYSVRKVNRE